MCRINDIIGKNFKSPTTKIKGHYNKFFIMNYGMIFFGLSGLFVALTFTKKVIWPLCVPFDQIYDWSTLPWVCFHRARSFRPRKLFSSRPPKVVPWIWRLCAWGLESHRRLLLKLDSQLRSLLVVKLCNKTWHMNDTRPIQRKIHFHHKNWPIDVDADLFV